MAAHLALGARLEEAGQPIDPTSLTALDLDATMLADGPLQPGEALDIRAPDGRFEAVWARTFAEVDPGEVLLFEDSSGALALAVGGGSAAGLMNLAPDGEVTLRPLR